MKQLKLRNIFALFTLLLSLVAAPAWALSKDEAKNQGLMGEQHNGYLGIVT
jgi:uncharacterized protein YdbL (DUF1318 family)